MPTTTANGSILDARAIGGTNAIQITRTHASLAASTTPRPKFLKPKPSPHGTAAMTSAEEIANLHASYSKALLDMAKSYGLGTPESRAIITAHDHARALLVPGIMFSGNAFHETVRKSVQRAILQEQE